MLTLVSHETTLDKKIPYESREKLYLPGGGSASGPTAFRLVPGIDLTEC